MLQNFFHREMPTKATQYPRVMKCQDVLVASDGDTFDLGAASLAGQLGTQPREA